jgi:hypothetical protein
MLEQAQPASGSNFILLRDGHSRNHGRLRPVTPSEASAVDQRLSSGIYRVEPEVGDGDFIAGQIVAAGKLVVRGVKLRDQPILVELNRRLGHLFRHTVAEEEMFCAVGAMSLAASPSH